MTVVMGADVATTSVARSEAGLRSTSERGERATVAEKFVPGSERVGRLHESSVDRAGAANAVKTQIGIHATPMKAAPMKAVRHPTADARATIRRGQTAEPIELPM